MKATESKLGHTPGPWVVVPQADGRSICFATPGGCGQTIGEVWVDLSIHHERAEANVTLIAAAPDLLAALKTMVEASCDLPNCGACTKARNAIAKAEGKTGV